jgi:hypothetical protein
MMMMTEMDIETSVYYVHLTRLIAREDFIKFTRRESTKTYIVNVLVGEGGGERERERDISISQSGKPGICINGVQLGAHNNKKIVPLLN